MNPIKISTSEFDLEYSIEEKGDFVVVKAPFICENDEGEDAVDFDVFEAEGKKADMIRQFFQENSLTIVRGEIAFNLDEVLTDASPLPQSVEESLIF